jgi:plastocyanin
MTTKILIALALTAFLVSPPSAIPGDADRARVTVTADIQLIEDASHPRVKDASGVVMWLAPPQTTAGSSGIHSQVKRHYRMLQHNKTFEPNLLVVPLGSIVDFPNLDPWFHNVFSLYQGKRFDLGLYQAGAEKQVVFDRPGPSFLFCNIHPQMTAVILAVNSDLFGVSDRAGRIVISGVPMGRYAIHLWYESAASEFNEASARIVDIGPTDTTLPLVTIPVVKRDSSHKESHKDKYGYDYDPKATMPAY